MSRDPDEEFELVRSVVETTKRYLDSKHLSRYIVLPYDPLAYYVLAVTMQLPATHNGVKKPERNCRRGLSRRGALRGGHHA